MSDKERVTALLEYVPSYKMGYLLAYVQGLVADEEADDAFCESMYQKYLNDPDRGDFVSLDDAVKELGLSPDELRVSD